MAMTEESLRTMFGIRDPRSAQGMMARGRNIYMGGSPTAQSGQGALAGTRYASSPIQVAGQPPVQGPAQSAQLPPMPQLTHLPFLPEIADQQRALMGQQAQFTSQQEAARRRLQQQYDQSRLGLGRALPEAYKGVSQRMANQGLTRSGINVGQQAKVGENYRRQLEGLETSRAQGAEDLSQRGLTAQQGFANQMAGLQTQNARLSLQGLLEQIMRRSQQQAAIQAPVGAPIWAGGY